MKAKQSTRECPKCKKESIVVIVGGVDLRDGVSTEVKNCNNCDFKITGDNFTAILYDRHLVKVKE